MQRIVLLVFTAFLIAACEKYDDSALVKRIEALENSVEALEASYQNDIKAAQLSINELMALYTDHEGRINGNKEQIAALITALEAMVDKLLVLEEKIALLEGADSALKNELAAVKAEALNALEEAMRANERIDNMA
ncbi:hypothetical protein [Carboxylicivirga taeanensis]|uniref:hypothetical protein n=1 Tax=Carboxylicivirga taeanensis TaxID=1416875 RepID=UPI003F6DE7A1